MGKESLFNTWCWQNWMATWKKMKLDYFLNSYTKVNLKWIRGLNVSNETISLLEENAGKDLLNLSMSNFFLDTSPRARETK